MIPSTGTAAGSVSSYAISDVAEISRSPTIPTNPSHAAGVVGLHIGVVIERQIRQQIADIIFLMAAAPADQRECIRLEISRTSP